MESDAQKTLKQVFAITFRIYGRYITSFSK